MSSENTHTEAKSSYVLVPATIVEEGEELSRHKNTTKRTRYPYGSVAVDGGYILNGTFYTDFSTEKGKAMIRRSLIPKLEFLFSEKYLTIDKFLRSYMDVEGYFPISLLFYIPAIQTETTDVKFLASVLSECGCVEVDLTRLTVRVKNDWEKWVLPNADGGKGVPRYEVLKTGITHELDCHIEEN